MSERPSNNRHKDVHELVREIYHEWEWENNPEFRKDVEEKEAGDFATQFHHGIGMQIRNSYGLWKGDTDLYDWFIEQGYQHPDDMSHRVFIELHKYARAQMGLSSEEAKEYVPINRLEINIALHAPIRDEVIKTNLNMELERSKKMLIQQWITDGHITVDQAIEMDEYYFKVD
jgi:hypothetical protein